MKNVIQLKRSNWDSESIRSLNVEVTPEQESNYYSNVSSYRIKRYRAGLCWCPKSDYKHCDCDCCGCKYRKNPPISLDESSDGQHTLYDFIPNSEPSPEEQALEDSRREKLDECLAALPEQLYLVVEYKRAKYTDAEIGALLGISREAVNKRWRKAVEILKRQLADY